MDKRYGTQLTKEDLIGKENGVLVCIDLIEVVHKKNYWDYVILAKCKNCGNIQKMTYNNFRSSSRKNSKSCRNCVGKYIMNARTELTGLSKHERLRLAGIKNGAKQRKKEFLLENDEVKELLNKPCVYCGKQHADGIDRIDSSKGYIKNNVVPCCAICNRMKNNYSVEFFKSQIDKIYKWLHHEA